MGTQKDWNNVIREAVQRGWKEIRTKKHIILVWPETNERVTMASTPSDWRAIKNMKSRIRRVEKGIKPDG